MNWVLLRYRLATILLKLLATGGGYRVMARWKKHTSRVLQRRVLAGKAIRPRTAKWEITLACNLNCAMCHQRLDRAKQDYLTWQEAKSLVRTLAGRGIRRLILKGGEVTCVPYIYDLIDFAGASGMRVRLLTNGYDVQAGQVNQLIRKGVIQAITLSIDGAAGFHNQMRGKADAYQRTMALLERLAPVVVNISSVWFPNHSNQLEHVFEQVVRPLRIPVWTVSIENAPKQSLLLSETERLGISLRLRPGAHASLEPFQQQRPFMLDLQQRAAGAGTLFILQPGVFMGVSEGSRGFCDAFYTLNLDAKGRVLFCPFMKKNFGPLHIADGFPSRGNEYTRFTRRFLTSGMSAICPFCCKYERL